MTILEQIKQILKDEFSLNNDTINKLQVYCDTLMEESSKYNLTAIKEENAIFIKHFYDSLTLTKTQEFSPSKSLIDVGTGAGFPGMVIAICYPEMDVTLLDATQKKCQFLRIIKEKLNLKNVKIVCSRIEELDDSYVEKFDLVTARAVASINVLLELTARIMKVGGQFLALRGAQVLEEREAAKSCLNRLGLIDTHFYAFELLKSSGTRGIITYTKSEKTDKQFPRKYSQILNKPL